MDSKPMLEERINEPLHMSPFYYRPFCLLALAFALTVTAILLFDTLAIIIASALWLCYATFHFVRMRTLRLILPWLLLIALIASFTVGSIYVSRREPIKRLGAINTRFSEYINTEPPYKISKIKAEVISVYYCERFGSSYLVKILTVDGEKAYGHATLESTDQLNAVPYDILYCNGVFFTYDEANSLYARSKDIIATIETDTAAVRYEENSKINRKAYELREKISFNLHKVCDNSSAASFAMAVVFGVRDGMDQALERDCSALGIIHLLAVSGSHFSTLIAALAFVLRRTYVPGHIRQLYFAAFAIAFTVMCGGTTAILRAAIMTVFCTIVRFFGYEADSFIGLFFSLAAISIFRPYCVFDIGFLLSFFSTFGILLQLNRLIIPNKKEKLSIKIVNAIWGAFRLTLSATLFSFPILAIAYGNIAFIGLAVNLIAGLVITLAMFVAIILMVTCNIPVIGPFVADVFEFIYSAIQKGSAFIAENTDTAISLRAPYVIFLILIPLCLFLLLRLLAVNDNLLAFIPMIVSIACLLTANTIYTNINSDTAELALVSVKSNECLVLKAGNKSVICDLSDGTRAVSEEAIDTVFDDFYCVGIDGYMLTHYHAKHIYTLGRLLQNYYIQTVILPTPTTSDEEIYAKYIETLTEMYGGDVIYYSQGEEFGIYGANIIAMKAEHAKSSHLTLAVSFSYNGNSITYLGSGYSDSKAAVDMFSMALKSDTVILGAHGPAPTEPEFFVYQQGRRIYVSPQCGYQTRDGIETKLTATDKGICKAFWRLAPSS